MRLPWILLTVAYCAAIFYLSSQQLDVPKYKFPGRDKVAHLIVYGGLAAVVSNGIRRRGKPTPPPVQFWVPVVFVLLYGMSDEIHQSFVPGRNFDPWDVVANVVSALLIQSFLCLWLWKPRPLPA